MNVEREARAVIDKACEGTGADGTIVSVPFELAHGLILSAIEKAYAAGQIAERAERGEADLAAEEARMRMELAEARAADAKAKIDNQTVELAKLNASTTALRGNLRALMHKLHDYRTWDDAPLPEDDQIEAVHPTQTGRHDLYDEAMRLVGARRSKGALVDLVTWLLTRLEAAEGKEG